MMVCGNCGYTGDDNTYVCPMCGAQMYYQDDGQYYGNYDGQQNTYDQGTYGQEQYGNDYYYNNQADGYNDNNGYQQYDNGYYQQQPAQQQMPPEQPSAPKKKFSFSLGLKKKEEAAEEQAAQEQQMGVTNDGRQFFIPDAKKKTKRTSNSTVIIVTTIFAVLIVLTIYITGGDEEQAVVSGFDAPKIVSAMDNTFNLKSADFTINYNYKRINGSFEVGTSTADTKFYASSGNDEETLITGNYYTSTGGSTYSVTENYNNEIGFELVNNGSINKEGIIKLFAYDDQMNYEAFMNKLNKFANDLIVNSNYMSDYIKSYEIVESTQTLVTYRAKVDMKALCNELNRVVGTKLDSGKFKGISTATITVDNNYITVLALKSNFGDSSSKLVVRLSNLNTAKVDVAVCNKIKTDAVEFIDKYGSLFPDDKHTSIFDCFNSDDDSEFGSDTSDDSYNYDDTSSDYMNDDYSDVSSAFWDDSVESSFFDTSSQTSDGDFSDQSIFDDLTSDDGFSSDSLTDTSAVEPDGIG